MHRSRVNFPTPIFYCIIVKGIQVLDFWYNLETFWALFKHVISTFSEKSTISIVILRPKSLKSSKSSVLGQIGFRFFLKHCKPNSLREWLKFLNVVQVN